MAAYINDRLYDLGLIEGTNATDKVLYLCTAQPANQAGVAAVAIGHKNAPTVGSPTAGTTGRKIVVSAFTDGVCDSNDQLATHFALVGTMNSVASLIAAGPLASSQRLYTANPISVGSIDIGFPAPV